jgi:penicillin-binding protein 1A
MAVDYRGRDAALVADLTGDHQGASTITMQVARNFSSQEKTVKRKLTKPARLSHRVGAEQDQILDGHEPDLPRQTYPRLCQCRPNLFNKRLQDLSLAEAACWPASRRTPPSIIRRSIRYAPRLVR